jgi:predicted nucleotidyltransferase
MENAKDEIDKKIGWSKEDRARILKSKLAIFEGYEILVTGSWARDKARQDSDFDFVCSTKDWVKMKQSASFLQGIDYVYRKLAYVHKLRQEYRDPSLIDIVFFPALNVELQINSDFPGRKLRQEAETCS